ncbi:phage tail tape measure protein [Phocaeicola vulgatus]|uniref:phage tail tape measure protein n=1 Tax=Phocaeicola vulgatus TaxID=821 RepID=UPI001E5DB762|nr:phage tail tape measure protein [Phocaeicola vulgatus]MDB1073561.1 phage tail tape measure protein [Phocaeicola vulgatus]
MAGIISNVDSDVQKLRKLKNEIENVKKALMGINIKVDIDIAKGLQSQLTSLLGQYDALVDKIAAAEGKIMLSVSRINKATEKIVKAQEVVSKPTADPAQNGDAARQTNTAETESVRAQAKAYDDLRTEINGILGTREENVKRMIDEMNAIRLINAEIKKINKSQGDYSSLSSAQQKRLEQLNNSLLTHKTALSEVRQALNNNAKLDNVAATSMNGLSQSLSRMRIAYRELTEEERNSPFGKELLASIQQADTKIKELDTTIGNHQRNVGNYGKQWNGLSMSIQQVGRELPSLAYGPKVFFSAISNNIPILADEIKRARTEYKLLKESGQSAIPVWKQVVSSLFSWQTVLTVGITLLTLYGDKVVDWVAGLFNAKNVMKPLVDIQQQLNDVQLKGVQNAQSEITKLELLYKATQNASKPIRERKKAVDELQKSYPDFFKNLSEEEILTGKAADAYARLTSSIIASARARAAQDKMTENAKKILENEAKITEEYAKRENAQLKLDKQIELRNKIDREANPDMYAGQQMKVGAALGKVEEIDEGIAKLRREIYELNKSQNELAQNIDVNDLIFNPNEDSSKIGEEERKRRQEEAEKLLKQQEQLSEQLAEELLSLHRQNQQDEINLMREGTEKKLKQIDLDYQKQIDAIRKQEEEWSKAGNGKLTDKQAQKISEAYTNAESMRDKDISDVTEGQLKAEQQALNDYLKEYGTFQQQKLAIAQEYAEKIRKAQEENGVNSAQVKLLEKQRDVAIQNKETEAIKANIDWVTVFGEFGSMFSDMIKPALDEAKKYVRTDKFKNSDQASQKSLIDAISQMEKSLGGTSGVNFKKLGEDVKAYQIAEQNRISAIGIETAALERLKKSQDDYTKAQKGGTESEKQAAANALETARQNADIASANVKTQTDIANQAQRNVTDTATILKASMENLLGGLQQISSGGLYNAYSGIIKTVNGFKDVIGKTSESLKEVPIVGWILSIIDVLKDGLSDLVGGLLDAVLNAVSGIIGDVLSGDLFVTIGKSLRNGIGNILNAISFGGFNSLFGIGGNAKEVQETIDRLTDRNGTLQTAIEDLTDEMKASKGMKSVESYREAVKYQEEVNKNYLQIAKEQAGYHKSHGSWQHYLKWTDEMLEHARKATGMQDFSGTDSLWNLTPEQMKALRSDVWLWDIMESSGKGGYGERVTDKLDDYIEQAGKLEELTDSLYEGLIGMSFDSMYDSFISSLMDMEKSAEDFANDISKYFMQAMLSNAIGEQFSDKLRTWYDKFGEAMKDDGTLDNNERKELMDEYMGYVDEAMKLRDELAAATGYDKISQEAASQSASSKGFQTMSQDTGEELNGRFTALQIAGEEIKNQNIIQSQSLNLLTVKADALLSINTETRNIADDTRDLIAQSYLELVQISENTGAIVKPIQQMQRDIAEVKKNTAKL